MTTITLFRVIDAAAGKLPTRASYARDVLAGYQRWSGADLKGKAARYSAGYAQQRSKAASALHAAGGCVLALRQRHGLRTTAVALCVDDFGSMVYDTIDAGIVTADQVA